MGGVPMPPQQQPFPCEAFVDVLPDIKPNFNRAPNGHFVMGLPPIRITLQTQCNPPYPSEPGLTPFKPHEEFYIHFPEVQQVVFDGTGGGNVEAHCTKSGAVLECAPYVQLDASVKANSPYGSLILEDIQTTNGFQQKVGETTLNYRLQVEAQVRMNNGAGNYGANRLEVWLQFNFQAQCVPGGGGAMMGPGDQGMPGGMPGGGQPPQPDGSYGGSPGGPPPTAGGHGPGPPQY
jgi:hypothetical protein